MDKILPTAFLYRVTIACPQVASPRGDKLPQRLPATAQVPHIALLDACPSFARLSVAWNQQGLTLIGAVDTASPRFQCDRDRPLESDGLHVWIDTRDTRTIHRASRFCHHFFFLPSGGGAKGDEPMAGQLKVHRATADAPLCAPHALRISVQRQRRTWRLAAFLPAPAMHGFDPAVNRRLGFYYLIRDANRIQYLSVGSEFPFAEDPSLWATLELIAG
jgi:hypothetical protein